ncbi:MAG: rubrerythrin [Planctomycetes bacterium]|nr:rubrerythrin [Planctomycetota bacterium]
MTTATKIKKKQTLSDAERDQIVAALQHSYNMEIETVANYVANSIHLDGLLATEVKESLAKDVTEELGHAHRVAHRIKILGGQIPGSQNLKMEQTSLQPPESTIDVESVIRGVIEAEDAAIDQYQKIIEMTSDIVDPVTQDMAIQLKGEEEEHRREFVGFLREYESFRKMLK